MALVGSSRYRNQREFTSYSRQSYLQREEDEFQKQHTFTPTINDRSRQLSKSRQERNPKPYDSLNYIREQQEANRLKREEEERQELSMCTFTPNVNPSTITSTTPFHRRLYEDALQREQRRKENEQRKAEQAEVDENPDCTFHPDINPTPPSFFGGTENKDDSSSIPLPLRAEQLQREKMEKINQLRIKHELPKSHFQPKINPYSKKLVETAPRLKEDFQEDNVILRMEKETEKSRRAKEQLSHEITVESDDQLTHKPEINNISRKLTATSGLFKGSNSDFLKRQETYNEMKLQRKAILTSQIEAEKESENSDELRTRKISKQQTQSTIQRLAEDDVRRRMEEKERREREEEQKRRSATPKITRHTRETMKDRTLKDLIEDTQHRQAMDKAQAKMDKEFASQHTFTPNTKRPRTASEAQWTERIEHLLADEKRRQEFVEREKRRREYEELKDCTFTPKVLKYDTNKERTRTVAVKGLWRHLELQDLARQMEATKKEMERDGQMRTTTPKRKTREEREQEAEEQRVRAEKREKERARRMREGAGVLSEVVKMGGSGMGKMRQLQANREMEEKESDSDSLESLLGLTPRRRRGGKAERTPRTGRTRRGGLGSTGLVIEMVLEGKGARVEGVDDDVNEEWGDGEWRRRVEEKRRKIEEDQKLNDKLRQEEEEEAKREEMERRAAEQAEEEEQLRRLQLEDERRQNREKEEKRKDSERRMHRAQSARRGSPTYAARGKTPRNTKQTTPATSQRRK